MLPHTLVRLLGGFVLGVWLAPGVVAAAGPALHGPPRFGLRGGRHRVVLSLSTPYEGTPRFRPVAGGVEVTLPGVRAAQDVRGHTFSPPHGDSVIRWVSVRHSKDGAVLRLRWRRAAAAEAWVLAAPARVAVDLIERPRASSRRSRGRRKSDRKRAAARLRTSANSTGGKPPQAKRAARQIAGRARRATPAGRLIRTAGSTAAHQSETRARDTASVRRMSPDEHARAGQNHRARTQASASARLFRGRFHRGNPERRTGALPAATAERPAPASQQRREDVGAQPGSGRRPDALGAGVAGGGPAPKSRVVEVNGYPFVWPELNAAYYGGAGLEKVRAALRTWRESGTGPTGLWRREPPAGTAGRYLAADLAYLEAANGSGDFLQVADLYRRALRSGQFPEVVRARFLLGQCYANIRFGPEAEAALAPLLRELPNGPLAAAARLGLGMALEWEGRLGRARDVLARAAAMGGYGGCRAAARLADLDRRAGDLLQAVAEVAALERDCGSLAAHPAVLLARARVLRDAGQGKLARELLEREPRGGTSAERERVSLLKGELSSELGDATGARDVYAALRSSGKDRATVAEATIRLAILEEERTRAAGLLAEIYDGDFPPGARARALEAAAEMRAAEHRYETALSLLERASRLGPAPWVRAERKEAEIVGRWIAELAAAGEAPAVATVFARYRSFEDLLPPRARLLVAESYSALGLPRLAAQVARRLADSEGADAGAAARALAVEAESELRAGDFSSAAVAARRLLGRAAAPGLRQRARAVAARAELAAGNPEGAEKVAGPKPAATLRVEIAEAYVDAAAPGRSIALLEPAIAEIAEAGGQIAARAYVALGRARQARGDLAGAAAQYRAALEAAPGEGRRLGAGYRLAGIEEQLGDNGAAVAELRKVASSGNPWLRRAAAAEARLLEDTYDAD